MKVGVIDYGVGNLGSVVRALETLGVSPVLLSHPAEMRTTDCLILPGVGNFSDCVRLLQEGGWSSALRDEVLDCKQPLLGVCVGMQLLADSSSEGAHEGKSTPGLGFIPGHVKHLSTFGCALRIPHVGWNSITIESSGDPLFGGIPNGTDFYFVHSYAFDTRDTEDVLATADYGIPVTAAVRRGHVWGTQFHPEKSSRAGFRLLKNFVENSSC